MGGVLLEAGQFRGTMANIHALAMVASGVEPLNAIEGLVDSGFRCIRDNIDDTAEVQAISTCRPTGPLDY